MFKGYHNSNSSPLFRGIPNLNFQGNVNAYGFSGVTFWLDAAFGLNTQTNLGAISRWQSYIGNIIYLQSTSGNQPRLILNDSNFNNFPCVQSIDANRFMDTGVGLGFNYNVRIDTIAFVAKVDTGNFCNGIAGYTLASSFSGLHLGGSDANLTGAGIVNNTTQTFQGTTEGINARIVVITPTNIIVNGVTERTGTTLNLLLNYHLLMRAGTGNIIGRLSEIIKYDYSFTESQAIELSNNINQKYALY